MAEAFRNIVFLILPWIILLPLSLSLMGFRRHPAPLKIIAVYLIVSTITQLVSLTCWLQKINNLPLLHAFTLTEYFLLLRFYQLLLPHSWSIWKLMVFLFAMPAFLLFDSIWLEGWFHFNVYGRSLEAIAFIWLSLFWFVQQALANKPILQTFSSAIHVINSGFLIYFSGSLLLFSFRNIISQTTLSWRLNIWTLHSLLAAVLYGFIAIGLWKYWLQQKSISAS
ncbi:MAG TPA: hypothetical protein PKK69_07905 [Ferruginibacter sp.]|nr:hypothetical protein [Ferruginibacter sp.]